MYLLFFSFLSFLDLFSFLQMSSNFDSIEEYQTCMRMVGKIMALNVEKNYASEEHVSELFISSLPNGCNTRVGDKDS